MPHKDEFSSEAAYKAAEGVYGYPAMQGFYVYRGKRMLLAGDWLGLFRKEEHYKLVRILIDLPNTLDTQWQIDIKKSTDIKDASFSIEPDANSKRSGMRRKWETT